MQSIEYSISLQRAPLTAVTSSVTCER